MNRKAGSAGLSALRVHLPAFRLVLSDFAGSRRVPAFGHNRALPISPVSTVLLIVLFLFAMSLSSCGFQLRGQVAIPYKTIFIETAGYSQFAGDLERAIRSGSQTRVVSKRDEAEAVLKITGELQENRILSLSSGGRVREFDLR